MYMYIYIFRYIDIYILSMYIHEGISMKGRNTLAAFLAESAAYRIFHDISISLANDIPLGSCFFLPPVQLLVGRMCGFRWQWSLRRRRVFTLHATPEGDISFV